MEPYKSSLLERATIGVFKTVNKYVAWYKLPPVIGVLNLLALRFELRAKNLYDTYPSENAQGTKSEDPMPDHRFLVARNSDGKFNSLEQPRMGCSGMRFGRNVPRTSAKKPSEEELMDPNPRVVSEKLMARQPGTFKPATIINLLAAAWIQFQVHDWAFHETSDEEIVIPLPEGDSWPDSQMKLPRSKPDQILDDSDRKCPGYVNSNTAWWDGSQLYGSTEERTKELRGTIPHGKLPMTNNSEESFIPRDSTGLPLTGFNSNWWIGLELLHTLFALEHNAICDELHSKYPTWTSDQLFDKARLINCALMAKIHTVEWTPAILAHPTLHIAMHGNWWGLVGESLTKLLGRVSKSDVISGIPGSGADQDGVPYSLSEEFVSVYRMHPLIPDDVAFFNIKDGKHKTSIPIEKLAFEQAQVPLHDGTASFADAFYSFGINFPGALTLHNTPNFMRNLPAPDGIRRDMATVDILRDRERGVPRYNEFRRLFHMPAPSTFEELTGGNLPLAEELKNVYGNDIEKVDLLIGCHSEPLPKGFGFSDTAFRVFILMASRRLKSDRFLATQWNEKTYTKEGIHWVQYSTMRDILCRHYPELGSALKKGQNAFAPWQKVGKSAEYKGKETNA